MVKFMEKMKAKSIFFYVGLVGLIILGINEFFFQINCFIQRKGWHVLKSIYYIDKDEDS